MNANREPKAKPVRGAWLLAVLLAGVIVAESLAGYLSASYPALALRLNSSQPEALLNLADEALNAQPLPADGGGANATADAGGPEGGPNDLTVPLSRMAAQAIEHAKNRATSEAEAAKTRPAAEALSAERREQIRALASKALANDPLNARALRILGQVSEADSDPAQSTKYMRAALRRSLRETVAVLWMLQESERAKDWAAAVHFANVLFRTRTETLPFATYRLAQLAERKESAENVRALLRSNPPWRARFISGLGSSITDARTPLDLLLSLRDTPAPPSNEELKSYLGFLVSKKFYELAYYAWLQFLPKEELARIGLLYNGNFERPVSGLPFDWLIAAGSGANAGIVPKPGLGEGHALSIELGQGRVDFRGVRQYTLLAPGTYQLVGDYKGEIKARRGLVWRASCAASGAVLGESPMMFGSGTPWKSFDFTFAVPAEGCRAQSLDLVLNARSASETIASGSMLFDDLKLTRQP